MESRSPGWRPRCDPRGVAPALLLIIAFAAPARAESIRERVRSHVGDELEREPEARRSRPPPRRSSEPKRSSAQKAPRSRAPRPRADAWDDAPEPEAVREGPKLPLRVIGRDLQLDPRIGGGYRGWHLQPYPTVDVAAQGYFTWSVEMQARFFRLINLRRGYYESNALSGPRTDEAVVAAQIGQHAPKAAWLLATVGVPINRAWEPILKYETRSFKTSATPTAPVRVVPHATPADTDMSTLPLTTERLDLVSGFETFVGGIRYSHSKDPSATVGGNKESFPSVYLGVGLLSYGKPYQVSVGDAVLDELLFDARFRGAGLAFGLDTKVRPDAFFVDVEGQVGLGEIRLLEDLTLNELLPQHGARGNFTPPEWLVGYVLGNATVGYLHPILRTQPTLLGSLALSAGGATFFAFKTQAEEGETVDAPPLNWDFLWGARAALILPL
jgi:hypothetical protein